MDYAANQINTLIQTILNASYARLNLSIAYLVRKRYVLAVRLES